MATFDINDVARRVQYTSTGQTGPFNFNFQVNASSELLVYIDDTEKTETTHYTVSLNADGTGSVTFTSATTTGELITIIGDQALSRTTVFSVGQVNNPTTLETEFDNTLIRQQQIKEITDRALQLKPTTPRTVTGSGTSGPLYWPYDATASNNASRVIAYDSNGTSLELGPTTANLSTLAGISSDISTVAGISSDITSVAADASDIGVVSTNIASVNTVATNINDVIAVANDLNEAVSEVETVANDLNEAVSEIDTVATSITNVDTVGNNISNVNTVATNIANVNTVAGISANVTTVAGISSDVTAVAADATDIGTVATNIANVNSVGGSISNVNTVAANITGVNSFAERYRVDSADPTTSLDQGDLAYNTTANALKYYDGSAWQQIVAGGLTDIVQDGTPQLGGTLDLNSNDITGTGNINITGTATVTGLTTTGDINFGDNDKAQFGASQDLQIYHDSGNSYITDTGTGALYLQSSSAINLRNATGTKWYLDAIDGGALNLYHNNSLKLATTSTGVDVTGTIEFGDGHTIGNDVSDNLEIASSSAENIVYDSNGGFHLWFHNGTERMRIDSSGNFLYAKTTTDTTTTGVEFRPSGLGYFGRSGGQPIIANRNTNDGTIVELRKDGATVGSINAFSGDMALGTGDVTLWFNDGGNNILPRGTSIGLNDNAVDLGNGSNRFKDLYLGGGAVISEATLTDGATISWDVSTQSVAKVTLGGNRTLSAPSNALDEGQFISLLVIQDGTGSRTLTWNAVYEFASDTAPTLTTTGGKGDLFVFRYNGTKWLEVGRNLNLTLS